MKGKPGRPHVMLPAVSNKKPDRPADSSPDMVSADAQMARGGKAKKRADKKARGGSIHIKKSHEGLLHKDLKVKPGNKIPEKKLEKAKNSPDPAVRKRATFAANAAKWKH